ncbi:protein C12orf4 homolog [Papilio machaon]|uniref:protein C12orf4 homolog n=1 Tax=Papilio machaon TaxID=76193 RepID=UPI001E6647CF|nr:protein C12orf4 homolog [Papilio machaon]
MFLKMTTERTETIVHNATKTFKYSFPTCTNEELLFKLVVPVEIPYDGSPRELLQRVINMFHIPLYLEDELNEKLAQFISDETREFHNSRDEKLLNQLKNNELNVDGIVKQWEKLFKENVVEFAEQKGTSDEEVFAAAYHKLVHSPALDTILQVENSYAKTVSNMMQSRDEDINKLTERQTEEMEEKMRLLNVSTTEEEINETAARQFEAQSVAAARWESQLDALRHTQRAAHRAWLMAALDHYQGQAELATPSNSPLTTFPPETGELVAPGGPVEPRPQLEESFTIHLGSQLKQTHNIRLVAADMLDLCALNHHDNGAAARLQPALALYSGELTGAVVLCEAGAAGAGEPPQRLLRLAAAATEHHFDDINRQLRHIAEAIREPAEQRNARRAQQAGGAGGAAGGGRGGWGGGRALRPGDVLVTRHSNLDTHVIFHLVVDDSLKADITSRHPAILGLRNILKAACCNDVTTISLPLLLRNEITEEMTAAWCVRRAELVLKCVKGFVLEAAGGGGAELRTLHAALPPHAPELFAAVQSLLPSVFRVAGPLRAPRRVTPL